MKVFYPYAYFYPETCAGTYLIDNVIEASAASGIESLMTVPTPTCGYWNVLEAYRKVI